MKQETDITPENTVDVSDYAAVRETLEQEPQSVLYPFEVRHSFKPHTREQLLSCLKASSFSWSEDKTEHVAVFVIRGETEAWEYVRFAEQNDYICAAHHVDILIKKVRRMELLNFLRKLSFQRTQPVLNVGDREKLIRCFMKD